MLSRNSALHSASEHGFTEKVNALLDGGTDVGSQNAFGYGLAVASHYYHDRTPALHRPVWLELAMQKDTAALCKSQRPDGDSASFDLGSCKSVRP